MILTTENASSPASAQGSGGNAPTLALARLTPRLRLVLAIVLIADVLDLMDSTTTNIAAPTIVREIGGGESPVKWLGASYALAIGVLLVVGGRLGDRFGKRRMFLIGIAGFGLASVFCGLSIGPTMLIAGRFVQGGFGAVLIPQGAGLLLKTFSGKQFPVVAMVFGLVLGGSAVLRPIVAGVIISAKIDRLNWRPMFLINIGLSVIGFVAGAVLLGAAMVGLTYGLIGGSTDGWTVAPIANIVAGVLLFGAFAVGQRTAAGPLLFAEPAGQPRVHLRLAARLDLFRRGQRLRLRRLTVLPLSLRLSPVRASLGLSPLMVGIIASSFFARPLIPKLGRRLVVAGLLVTLAGVIGLISTAAAPPAHINSWTMAPSILGFGIDAYFSSIFDVVVGDVAPDAAGSASGSLSAVQQLASAIGSAVVTTVFFARLPHSVVHALRTSLIIVGGIVVLWPRPGVAAAGKADQDAEAPT